MQISHRRLGGAVAAVGMALTALTACGSGGDSADGTVELSFLVDNSETTLSQANAVADAFNAANKDIKVEVETRPQGTEGDNVVKTRLSTGEMSDVFWYNSGSLLQALNPERSLADLTGDPVLSKVEEGFLPVVSQDEKVYGVPIGSATGGGILYNRKVYAELGLQVPRTWAEFMANNEKIKAAGKTAVISTYKDSWSSQLFVLADFYNVQAAVPSFAQDYTANKAKFATTPAALTGFQHLADVNAKGYQNKGYGSATVDQGLKLLLEGEGAHFPLLSFTLPPLLKDNPEVATDIGFFGVPGDDPAKAGATIWEPAAVYAAKGTEHLAEAKEFMAFVASPEGIEAIGKVSTPTGPYRVAGAKLPDDAIQAVKDIQAYIDAGLSAPALEYLSPVKGPSLEQITVAVGSGLTEPAEGAAQYDKDVEKQAKQLGLSGW
ncbi:ABC transporter substrate-binding protein [Actinocorallia populi]|uniref:ABC transporter substrate-binding protein n=1 Tax=Actinocorallia populi TaxID=2079200 RepID=UPI000D087CF0|nr:ABC transporter substrate-binding protein [Actinocorallia populi]